MTRQFLMFTSAIIILFNAAHAGDESRSSPKKPPLSPASTPTETWVWNEITAGRTGDLQKRCGVNLDSRDLNDPRWHDDCRNVSAAFITRALSESRWQQLLPAQGFRILGARVIGSINLTGAHISAPVWLDESKIDDTVMIDNTVFDKELTFDDSQLGGGLEAFNLRAGNLLLRKATLRKGLNLTAALITGDVSLNASTFEQGISADQLRVGGSFYLNQNAKVRGDPLHLVSVRVDRDIDMSESTFETAIFADRLHAGAALFLRSATVMGEVSIAESEIAGTADLSGSEFQQGIQAYGSRVGGTFRLAAQATVKGQAVVLQGATIGRDVELNSSTFEMGINAEALRLGGDFYLQDAQVNETLSLRAARIERNLELSRSKFGAINADGVHVGGDLALQSGALMGTGDFRLAVAKIDGDLIVEEAQLGAGLLAFRVHVGNALFLRNTVVSGLVNLDEAEIGGTADLTQSKFGSLTGVGLHVKGRLNGSEIRVTDGTFSLYLARVDSSLDLSRSKFAAGIDAYGLQVQGAFQVNNSAEVLGGRLFLIGGKITGDLELSDAKFSSGISIDRAVIGGAVIAMNTEIDGYGFSAVDANIAGSWAFQKSIIRAPINANGLHVGRSVLMTDVRFFMPCDFTNLKVAEDLDISNARLSSLYLNHAVVLGDFRLFRPEQTVRWEEDARLVLRDARVGVVQAGEENPWPDYVELQRFTYDRLGDDFGVASATSWLVRDPNFTQQPYQQVASVFRAAGDPEKADAVLYAARDRQILSNWSKGSCGYGLGLLMANDYCWNAVGLGILKVVIGYGIGKGMFLALIWVLMFTIFGAFVLWRSAHARQNGKFWCVGASLSHLLPIIALNREFENFFADPDRVRLKGWQQAYFSGHVVIGYILASFVVAAVAGLTQVR